MYPYHEAHVSFTEQLQTSIKPLTLTDSKISKCGILMAIIMSIMPVMIGLSVCFYFAYQETFSSLDTTASKNIFIRILQSDNTVLDSYAILLTFGLLYPQMIIGALMLLIINKNMNLTKYRSVLKPKWSEFHDICGIPLAAGVYISLFESAISNYYSSLIALLIATTFVVIGKICKSTSSFRLIMWSFPFSFWKTVFSQAQTLDDLLMANAHVSL
jgi:hypothetical protein